MHFKGSSNNQPTNYFSTQPFSILESNLSSLHLFNNDLSTSIISSHLQLHDHLTSQYLNNSLIVNSNDNISTTKKKRKRKKNLHYPLHRLTILKEQLRTYLKKKKKKRKRSNTYANISNIIVHHQAQKIESTSTEPSTMMDFPLIPDLSKRKYIYKDITLSNDNQSQINWVRQIKYLLFIISEHVVFVLLSKRIFQCTQQSSATSCLDQSMTSGRRFVLFC